ncbi:MAG: hypothetical protein AWM53_00356 [Candidatus Dichloromethanomonas elyunquensis]|nr:MAG: hypothetical protein AWM53_00356 [Candidatus Dichloromethanomonas elyunquensis]
MKKLPWDLLKQALGIILGSFTVALSVNTFILANRIADGGITGIAIILHYLFQLDVGLTVLVLNIPLFILGYKAIGKRLLFLSMIGVSAFTLALHFTGGLTAVTKDTLLAAVFGGLITGIGMGIIFRSQGSLGGTDILAIILNRKTPFSVGQIILGIDTIIFLGTAVLFKPETAMYAMIYMFIASKVIDLVQAGLDYSKSVMVITDKPETIASDIIKTLGRGVTYFSAEGAYSQTPKKIIYCIINRAQLSQMKEIVHRHDPDAFVSIADVSEVVGEGFGSWKGH